MLKLNKTLLFILFFILIIFATRFVTFTHPVLSIDETDFTVQSMTWLDGGKPYVDFVEKKPPLIFLSYMLAFVIGGPWNMTAVHVLFAALTALTGLFLFAAADKAAGKKAAVAALALFSVYQAAYDINDFLYAGTETLMNLFCAAGAYFFIASLNGKRKILNLALVGICGGIAVLAKQVAVSFIAAVGVMYLLKFFPSPRPSPSGRGNLDQIPLLGERDRVRGVALSLFTITFSFTIPILILIYYLHSVGSLPDFIRWVWTENITYSGAKVPWSSIASNAIVRFSLYVLSSLPLWILAGWGSLRRHPSPQPPLPRGEGQGEGRTVLFSLLWLLFSFPTVSLGWRFFPHYFLQFLPPLVILAAIGFTKVKRFKTFLVIVTIVLPLIGFFIYHLHEAGTLASKSKKEITIGETVNRITGADDKIFVWGHNSDIYFYAKRLPASRFAYCSYLTRSAEGYESYNKFTEPDQFAWSMLMDDLTRNKPKVIVDMSPTGVRGYDAFPIDSYPELFKFVQENYKKAPSVDGANVWTMK